MVERATPEGVIQTGLYWPGKRTEVERVVLPFQTVETLDPNDNSAADLFITYLDALFSVALDLIESDKRAMLVLPPSNTRFGLEVRMPHNERIAGFIDDMRSIQSWREGTLLPGDRRRLPNKIDELISLARELRNSTSIPYRTGELSLEDLLTRCPPGAQRLSGSTDAA